MMMHASVYIQFAENGNIRKWAWQPFEGGARYERAVEPRRDEPVDWSKVCQPPMPGVVV